MPRTNTNTPQPYRTGREHLQLTVDRTKRGQYHATVYFGTSVVATATSKVLTGALVEVLEKAEIDIPVTKVLEHLDEGAAILGFTVGACDRPITLFVGAMDPKADFLVYLRQSMGNLMDVARLLQKEGHPISTETLDARLEDHNESWRERSGEEKDRVAKALLALFG